MNFARILGYAVLHLWPTALLGQRLARYFSVPGYYFSVRFSGRSALFELACARRTECDAPVALYPDYICNIVPRALTEAGWIAEAYATDERLEPDWEALCSRMKRGDVGLLVGASVFGSSALLDDLADPEKCAVLRDLRVQVIVDLAQDVGLVRRLPEKARDIIRCVVSFNDKSFPGAMGGGILSDVPMPPAGKALAGEKQRFLYKRMIRSSLSQLLRWNPKREREGAFEYSSCNAFPFRFSDDYRPAKLQLICAVHGMASLGRYQAAKRSLLDRHAHLETRFASSAAYLIARDVEMRKGRLQKRSYAIEQHPDASLRPDYLIVHNKGFSDHG